MLRLLPLSLRRTAAALALLGLGACTMPSAPSTPEGDAPERLADVVVTDPAFDFSTTSSVKLELRMAEGSQPRAVEAFDSEGRRLMDGAFKAGATVDVRVPVGRADKVTLRIGVGTNVEERVLSVGANGLAVGDL